MTSAAGQMLQDVIAGFDCANFLVLGEGFIAKNLRQRTRIDTEIEDGAVAVHHRSNCGVERAFETHFRSERANSLIVLNILDHQRSEEHTSELHSHSFISY